MLVFITLKGNSEIPDAIYLDCLITTAIWHNYHKQDRKCAYNVTLRLVRVTTVAVEKV